MVAIFGSSPMPSHRINSGSSAIFGIGNSAEMKVMPTPRARLESPIAKPTITPPIVPRIHPVPIRMIEYDRWCQSAPLAASLVIATAIADGAGRNSGLTQPGLPANCHSPITRHSATHPEERPALGVNPPPRNFIGRGAVSRSACGERKNYLRAIKLDLALRVEWLLVGE